MRDSSELLRALPVAAAALACDLVTLQLLVAGAGWHYLLAAGAAFAVGLAVNYSLSVRFVFRFRRLSSRTGEFAVFALIGIGGLAINAAAIGFVVELLGGHYLVAKGFAAAMTFSFNFGIRRWLLFTPATSDLPCTIKT